MPPEDEVDPVAAFTSALSGVEEEPSVVEEATPPVATPPVESTGQSGGHPAWQDIYNAIPESLRENVKPTLEAWDKGVQAKLEQVHSQYAPYKSFAEQNIDAQQLEAGLQLYGALNNDPRGFFAYLQEFLGEKPPQNQQPVSGQGQSSNTVDLGEFGESPQGETDPRIAQQLSALQAQQLQMQQFIQAQQQAKAEQESAQWLTSEQARLTADVKQRRGIDMAPEDWNYVLGVAAAHNNMNPRGNPAESLNVAMKQFEAQLDRFTSRPTANSTAPPVFASSGGTPSTAFDPSKLTDLERRKLAVQMLNQQLKD